MSKPIPTYEVTNYETLNKFLMGTLPAIRLKEIDVERAEAISKVADKIVKNNLTMIMEKRRLNDNAPIPFFEPKDNQVSIG